MSERLTWEEIVTRYPEEWVVFTDAEYTADFDVISAHVGVHTASQDLAWEFFEQCDARSAGIDFTGEQLPAVDFAYVL